MGQGLAVGMLELVQRIAARPDWAATCGELSLKLTSVEGSIGEESTMGIKETRIGTEVLTFNSQDHESIRGCAARLKVSAVKLNILGDSDGSSQDAIVKGAASLLATDSQVQDVMDSTWAEDICTDVAHSFLTTKIALPKVQASAFCETYAQDLRRMRAGKPTIAPASQAQQDVQRLRKRRVEKAKQRAAQVISAAPAKQFRGSVPAKLALPQHAVATSSVSDDTDDDGEDLWKMF